MAEIEVFPNPAPHRNYTIKHICPEFTSVCPKTGQPDFATIELEYIPDLTCIELKSLKLYYFSFRDQGIYFESVINRLLDDLSGSCQPRWMRVTGIFNVRGGISSIVVAETGMLAGG
ncbi:MAG: preQ(1) synthase [Fimbriimonas sp.]|nr:preQ(1) synthase [Fimbriimonas sp.]